MLGGTVVNITGPCFDPNVRVTCHFDTQDVLGHYIDTNRVICVQPYLQAEGYIRFEISVGNERFKWRGRYFVGRFCKKTGFLNQTNSICPLQKPLRPPPKKSTLKPMPSIREHPGKFALIGIASI